jgi:hypothetical protein
LSEDDIGNRDRELIGDKDDVVDENGEDLDELLDDEEEEEDMKDQLKMPSDLEEDEEDDYGEEAFGKDEGPEFDQFDNNDDNNMDD